LSSDVSTLREEDLKKEKHVSGQEPEGGTQVTIKWGGNAELLLREGDKEGPRSRCPKGRKKKEKGRSKPL